MALLPWLICVASSNALTREVLYTGWSPVLAAMTISRSIFCVLVPINLNLFFILIYSLGGVILDFTVSAYKGIAVFQPVINGVGGNLVAVQASRLSTWLPRRENSSCTVTASKSKLQLKDLHIIILNITR